MATRKKITWLGNRHKGEFHRIVEGEEHPAACQIDEIKGSYRVLSKTAKALRALGINDAAKPCNKRFKSRH